jgi:hypothetical protein
VRRASGFSVVVRQMLCDSALLARERRVWVAIFAEEPSILRFVIGMTLSLYQSVR